MKDKNIILSICCKEDIKKITKDTKYINIAIDNYDLECINYFLLNGNDYSYADTINSKPGYIYTTYDTFKKGEEILLNIISCMPSDYNTLEKVRYLYISLGKIVGIDINVMDNKNDLLSFECINSVNNIWSSICLGKATDKSICKLMLYLCSMLDIKCEIVSGSIRGTMVNKIYLSDDEYILVDLYNDLANIQGHFMTKYFDKYNDDKQLDKKISYINDEYMSYYVDNYFKDNNYRSENIVKDILYITENLIDINSVGVYELSTILKNLFSIYAPAKEVTINNFYAGGYNGKEHFIVISYLDNYYSYNYSRRHFIDVDYDMIVNNIKDKKIGLYCNEEFNLREREVTL